MNPTEDDAAGYIRMSSVRAEGTETDFEFGPMTVSAAYGVQTVKEYEVPVGQCSAYGIESQHSSAKPKPQRPPQPNVESLRNRKTLTREGRTAHTDHVYAPLGEYGSYQESLMFTKGSEVVLKSLASGQCLRIIDGKVDGRGSQDSHSQFIVHTRDSDTVALQNKHDPNCWLAIYNGRVKGTGGGGTYCEFKVKEIGEYSNSESILLESKMFPGQHLGILPDGSINPPRDWNSEYCQFIPTMSNAATYLQLLPAPASSIPQPVPGSSVRPQVPVSRPGSSVHSQAPVSRPGSSIRSQVPVSRPGSSVRSQVPVSRPGSSVRSQVPVSRPGSSVRTQVPVSRPGSSVPSQAPVSRPGSSVPSQAPVSSPISSVPSPMPVSSVPLPVPTFYPQVNSVPPRTSRPIGYSIWDLLREGNVVRLIPRNGSQNLPVRLDGDAIKQGGSFIQTDSELEIVYPSPGVVMLRSVINPRQHIGINKKGNVNGNIKDRGDQSCHFRVHACPDDYVCFESMKYPGMLLISNAMKVTASQYSKVEDVVAQFRIRAEAILSLYSTPLMTPYGRPSVANKLTDKSTIQLYSQVTQNYLCISKSGTVKAGGDDKLTYLVYRDRGMGIVSLEAYERPGFRLRMCTSEQFHLRQLPLLQGKGPTGFPADFYIKDNSDGSVSFESVAYPGRFVNIPSSICQSNLYIYKLDIQKNRGKTTLSKTPLN